MSLFKALGLSFRAFLSNPLKFISDPANAVTEQRVKELVEEGKTAVEIEEELKAAGLKKGPGPLKVVVDAIGNVLEFSIDNLPKILLALAIIFVVWWTLRFTKATQ